MEKFELKQIIERSENIEAMKPDTMRAILWYAEKTENGYVRSQTIGIQWYKVAGCKVIRLERKNDDLAFICIDPKLYHYCALYAGQKAEPSITDRCLIKVFADHFHIKFEYSQLHNLNEGDFISENAQYKI